MARERLPEGSADDPLWTPPPGRYTYPLVPILRPKVGAPVKGVILTPVLAGTLVHYIDERSYQCRKPKAQCGYCDAGKVPRWYGYLCITQQGGFPLALCEITLGAVENCPDLADGSDGLRGRHITLTRSGHHRGPVTVRLGDAVPLGPSVPNPSVPLLLRRIWEGPRTEEKPLTPDADDLNGPIPL